jgi:hypothetical protein
MEKNFMKRLMIHFVIAVVMYFVGITAESIFNPDRRADNNLEIIESNANSLNSPESPSSSNIKQGVPEFTLDYDPKEFNPRGSYFVLGRKPKGFREFDSFQLSVDAEGKTPGYASFQTYSDETYNGQYTVTGLATKKRLTFTAVPNSEEDFEYRFEGNFLKGGIMSKARRKQAVLKGKLVKQKNGIKIAEGEVKFRVEYLGC